MFSWFPLFVPLLAPIRVQEGDTITVAVWRWGRKENACLCVCVCVFVREKESWDFGVHLINNSVVLLLLEPEMTPCVTWSIHCLFFDSISSTILFLIAHPTLNKHVTGVSVRRKCGMNGASHPQSSHRSKTRMVNLIGWDCSILGRELRPRFRMFFGGEDWK